MKTLKYKTSVSYECCIKTIGFYLNNDEAIQNWQIDISKVDKVLIVEGNEISDERIINMVQKAGFEIAKISDKRM